MSSHLASTPRVQDIENTVIKTQNGAAIKIKDIATVTQGAKIRLGQIGRATHRADGAIIDNPTRSKESCCCKKAMTPTLCWRAFTTRSRSSTATSDHTGILPKGVKIVPFLDRSNLVGSR